jgi:zinc finger protein 830
LLVSRCAAKLTEDISSILTNFHFYLLALLAQPHCNPLLLLSPEMADVRAMLRAEKASRSGSKSISKKRKVADDSSTQAEKRSRANDETPHVAPSLDTPTLPQQPAAHDEPQPTPIQEPSRSTGDRLKPPSKAADGQPSSPPVDAGPSDAVDEAEWAAFERDVASPEPTPAMSALDAIRSSAIRAEPMTAAEIESRQRTEAQRRERDRRDEEAEGDKEEAAQRLEDEFEQMEALELRIQRLKDLREELRKRPRSDDGPPEATPAAAAEESDAGESDGPEDDDDDDWNMGFR